MAYVQVPKDLTKIKTKFILGLTKRQALCFSLATVVGIPTYLLTRGALGSTVAAGIMVALMLPFFMLAMYEKDGKPLEVILKEMIEWRFIRPRVRVYRTNNIYAAMQQEFHEREVLGLGEGEEKSRKSR